MRPPMLDRTNICHLVYFHFSSAHSSPDPPSLYTRPVPCSCSFTVVIPKLCSSPTLLTPYSSHRPYQTLRRSKSSNPYSLSGTQHKRVLRVWPTRPVRVPFVSFRTVKRSAPSVTQFESETGRVTSFRLELLSGTREEGTRNPRLQLLTPNRVISYSVRWVVDLLDTLRGS